jgi:hypothetical protein
LRTAFAGFSCCLGRADAKRSIDALKLPKLVIHQSLQGQKEECSAPVERTTNCSELAQHRFSRRSRRRRHDMLAPKNSKLVDGVQLQLIKPRNVTGPCVDHRLWKSEARQARDFGRSDWPAPIRECGAINCAGQ